QLGQAGDAAVGAGDVADVGDADEREQVVLAGAGDLDVLDEHELVVGDVEGGAQVRLGVLREPGEELLVGARDAGRGLLEPLTVRVLPDGDQDLPHGGLDAGLVDGHVSGPTRGWATAEAPRCPVPAWAAAPRPAGRGVAGP